MNKDKVAAPKPKFYDCGICGHWHPIEFDGDCRDDANRFTTTQLEEKYGNEGEGWTELEMPNQCGTCGGPMRSAMDEGVGKQLEETQVCKDPNCASHGP